MRVEGAGREAGALMLSGRGAAAHFHLGQYARAIEDLNKAIAMNPTFAEVYSNRGLSNRAIGDASHADQDYQKAIALLLKNARGLNARAWMRALWGRDLNTALAECNTARAMFVSRLRKLRFGKAQNQGSQSSSSRARCR